MKLFGASLTARPGGRGSPTFLLSSLLAMSLLPASVVSDCKSLCVSVSKDLVMREFMFLAFTTGCINVKVYTSDRPPTDNELDTTTLDPADWSKMCDANVWGQGSVEHTVLPAENCTLVTANAGDTLCLYFGIEALEDTNLCDSGATELSYDLLRDDYVSTYGFCPAASPATLGEEAEAQGGGGEFEELMVPTSKPTFAPSKAPVAKPTFAPSKAPVAKPTDKPTKKPTISPRPTMAPTTQEPTISKRPNTFRPTRAPNTEEPTSSNRVMLTSAVLGGGRIDPGKPETGVETNSTVMFQFYPNLCLEPDEQATGILYGHFDADYAVWEANAAPGDGPFPITYTPDDGYSYPSGTNAHDHEYDEDCDCTFVDYFLPTASIDPISQFITDPKQLFRIVVINGDLNTAGFLSINKYFDDEKPSTYIPVTVYDDTPPEQLQVFSLGDPAVHHPDKASEIIQLEQFAMGYKKDAIARGPGGIIPTGTGAMKGNTPGQYGEYRNGALVMQLIPVDPTDLTNLCQVQPEWSNASLSTDPSQRSPQGPVYNCEVGHTVLYEGTLFWHWGGNCDGGGSTYDSESWPQEYYNFFNQDCSTGKADDPESNCTSTKLCYVFIDGILQDLGGRNFVVLEDIASDTSVEAWFANVDEECPETSKPTVSPAPSVSPRPSAAPTVSLKPSVNAFSVEKEESADYLGRCWRWAHTLSCHPDDALLCQHVDEDAAITVMNPYPKDTYRDGVLLTDEQDTGLDMSNDNCCPDKDLNGDDRDWRTWSLITDAPPDCVRYEIIGVPDDDRRDGTCLNEETLVDPVGGVIYGNGSDWSLDMPDGDKTETYVNGVGLRLSINEGSFYCSDCWLAGSTVFTYDASKRDEGTRNQCPELWKGVASSSDSGNMGSDLLKNFTFVIQADKNVPFALAANVWCGTVDLDNMQCAPQTEYNAKGNDWVNV